MKDNSFLSPDVNLQELGMCFLRQELLYQYLLFLYVNYNYVYPVFITKNFVEILVSFVSTDFNINIVHRNFIEVF